MPRLRWRDVLAEPLVIFPRQIAPSLFDALVSAYHAGGETMRIAQQAIQMQTIVNLVSGGMGVAWVPESLTHLQRAGVRYARVTGLPGPGPALRDQPRVARRRGARGGALRRARPPRAGAGFERALRAHSKASRETATIAGCSRSLQSMALEHPHIDPVAVSLGHWHIFGHDYAPAIHWYGLTYMVAFGLFVWLAGRRAQYPWFAREGWVRRDVEDLLFYGVLGVVLGGRLGYVIFYKPLYYADHLREILAVWNGGMSFHGGMLGVIVAMAFFAWQRKRPFLQVTDLIAPCVPLGLASGRVGNFINGELWGRLGRPVPAVGDGVSRVGHAAAAPSVADLPVPRRGHLAVRDPVDLRQEGARPRPGVRPVPDRLRRLRFVAEFFREPDDFLGDKTTLVGDPATHLLTFGWSVGQWLCVPMVIAGVLMFWWGSRQPRGAASKAA